MSVNSKVNNSKVPPKNVRTHFIVLFTYAIVRTQRKINICAEEKIVILSLAMKQAGWNVSSLKVIQVESVKCRIKLIKWNSKTINIILLINIYHLQIVLCIGDEQICLRRFLQVIQHYLLWKVFTFLHYLVNYIEEFDHWIQKLSGPEINKG